MRERGIKRENTLPYTPQYNGIAQRALEIMCDKAVALLREVIDGKSNGRRVLNVNMTFYLYPPPSTLNDLLRIGLRPCFDNIPTFRNLTRAQNDLAPGIIRCVRAGRGVLPRNLLCTRLDHGQDRARSCFARSLSCISFQ